MKFFLILAGISFQVVMLFLVLPAFTEQSTHRLPNALVTATATSTNAPPTTAPSPTLPPITHPPIPTPHPCEGQIPAAPKLKSPADGAIVQSDQVVLRWSKANCARRFQIRIRHDDPNRKIVHAWKDWIGNTLELTYLKPGKYRWRVTGCFHKVCGKRSSVQHFTVVP
mgnify:CR=1 FL=1